MLDRQRERTAVETYNRANRLLEERRFTAAIKYYKEALLFDPYMGEAYYNLGLAYDGCGDPASAKASFQASCDRNLRSGCDQADAR